MKRINCNNWVVIQLPSRGINEPNRNASIGTGYTVLDGSHNAENQNTEQDKTTKNRKKHAKQQTKHTKRKTGIVNMASSVGEKRCLVNHRRVISMA